MKNVVLFCCLVLVTGVISAQEADRQFVSNAVGQKLERLYEIDLYEERVRAGYVLYEYDRQDGSPVLELYHNDELVWEEVRQLEGSRYSVTRYDEDGNVLSSRTYIDDLLHEELLNEYGTHQRIEYHYDTNKHVERISAFHLSTGEKIWETSCFVREDGMLQGLSRRVEHAPPTGQAGDYALLFESDGNQFALGSSRQFTVTYTGDEQVLTTAYREGVKIEQKRTKQTDQGGRLVTFDDFKVGIRHKRRYDSSENILEEVRASFDGTILEKNSYQYNDEGELLEKQTALSDQTTTYRYSEHQDFKRVRVSENGELVKIIDRYPTKRLEQIFLDGSYYATITYDAEGTTIKGIEYAQQEK